MKVKKEKIIYICKKCGWRWIPKIPDKKPRACPYCKSYRFACIRSGGLELQNFQYSTTLDLKNKC